MAATSQRIDVVQGPNQLLARRESGEEGRIVHEPGHPVQVEHEGSSHCPIPASDIGTVSR